MTTSFMLGVSFFSSVLLLTSSKGVVRDKHVLRDWDSGSKEIFGFSFHQLDKNFRYWDWNRLTTAAWREDPELINLAHDHKSKAVLNTEDDVKSMLGNLTLQKEWVQSKVDHALDLHADGINFDLEEPLTADEVDQYTELIRMTADAFHAQLPHSQVSVDVPWSPLDIDGRDYDWRGIAESADLLFLMAYDMQSQIWGRCAAAANSPYALVARGLQQWLDIGIHPSKMVLGVPWYAYNYPCQPGVDGSPVAPTTDVCLLRSVPFRGAPCSDAAGSEVDYSYVMDLLDAGRNSTPVRWDEFGQSNYFNFVEADGSVHQVWFDDPVSLRMKFTLAARRGLRGVGVWNLDALDYNQSNPRAMAQTRDMWEAFDAFLKPQLMEERATQ